MLLRTALALAQRGLAIFPVRPRDKRPATANGCKDATTDAAQIEHWWRTNSELNIGIATGAPSGVFVVDVDGHSAEAALYKLEAEHGALPASVEAITARGRHIYFRMPADSNIGNSAGKIADGVDVRGNGGYVLAPPSMHPSGRRYYWSVDSAAAFAEAPAWLLQRIVIPTIVAANAVLRVVPSSEWRQLAEEAIGEGRRNDTLTRITGHLLRHRVDPFLALALMQAWNAANCSPPLPELEVTQIVNSICGIELHRRKREQADG
jgi:hypothetical protein